MLGTFSIRLLEKSEVQLEEKEGWVEHIPVRWVEPAKRREGANVAIFTSGFTAVFCIDGSCSQA